MEDEKNLEQIEEQEKEEKKGFLDFDEYVDKGGDPEAFQGHKAYEAYGKLIKEVKGLKNELRHKDTTLKTMADLYRKEEERLAEKYRNYYQQQQYRLQQAEEMGDSAEIRDSSRALADTEYKYQAELQQHRAQAYQQLIDQFKERNADWYNDSNPDLQKKAQQLAVDYEKLYPHLATQDPVYLLQKVEEEIRIKHLPARQYDRQKVDVPEGANYTMPPAQSVANKGGAKANTKLNSLSPEMKEEFKQVSKFYESQGIDYTLEDYLGFHERNRV